MRVKKEMSGQKYKIKNTQSITTASVSFDDDRFMEINLLIIQFGNIYTTRTKLS